MTTSEVLTIIATQTKEVLPELENHEFTPADQLKALGANSIDRAEIVMLVLETLDLDIPKVELMGLNNIGELAEALVAKLQTA